MQKKLVIVESPSKATTIKKYLGKGFNVVASMGHIIDLPKSQLGIDIENNFEPRYITIRGKGDTVKMLKREAKNAQIVYLATDPDREGEAISWHLANLLEIDKNSLCRVTFNEITKKAVTSGISKPRCIDENLVDAQQARRVLDRIVGYKISPILWKKVKKGLSAGRVQSVAVKLICDREEEINKFTEQEYWSVEAMLSFAKKKFPSYFYSKNGKKPEYLTESEASEIVAAVSNKIFKVTDVKNTKKKKSPAPPFITSTLQQEAGRKLSFTSAKTMQTAQMLYEGVNIKGKGQIGLITYMRTDSLRVSEDAVIEARKYIESNFGTDFLPSEPRIYKTKKNAQDAHEAIRPSYPELAPDDIKDSLTSDQYKIYKIIWDRFISSQMKDEIIDTVTYDFDIDGYLFKSTGSTIVFPGFSLVYSESKDENEKKESKIPVLKTGDITKTEDIKKEQHFTQPPSRYSEALLIKTLEELGIGRPSTYAPTISTIIARGYISRNKKTLIPTELGMIVNNIMCDNFKNIVDVKFTADMENDLDKIEEGNLNWKNVISEFYTPFDKVLKVAEEKIGDIEIKDEESDIICDKCGRKMVYKQGKFGKFLACPGFPECRNTMTIVKKIGVKCPKCGNEVVEKKSRRGKIFFGCSTYPQCDFNSWDMPTNDKCPNCGSTMYKKAGRKNILYCPVCNADDKEKK